MMLADLLNRLDGVQQRGNRYVALCPAHADKNPSLSIHEGERGILIRCWAGCTVAEICCALGIKTADLFFDAGLPRHQRPIVPRPRRVSLITIAFQFQIAALDRRLRADRVLATLTGLELCALPDQALDRLVAVAGQAYADLDRADLLEEVADGLVIRHRQRGVAA